MSLLQQGLQQEHQNKSQLSHFQYPAHVHVYTLVKIFKGFQGISKSSS